MYSPLLLGYELVLGTSWNGYELTGNPTNPRMSEETSGRLIPQVPLLARIWSLCVEICQTADLFPAHLCCGWQIGLGCSLILYDNFAVCTILFGMLHLKFCSMLLMYSVQYFL